MDSLAIRSGKFQEEFLRADIGKRPILFVCHSLGGLLIKQILLG